MDYDGKITITHSQNSISKALVYLVIDSIDHNLLTLNVISESNLSISAITKSGEFSNMTSGDFAENVPDIDLDQVTLTLDIVWANGYMDIDTLKIELKPSLADINFHSEEYKHASSRIARFERSLKPLFEYR